MRFARHGSSRVRTAGVLCAAICTWLTNTFPSNAEVLEIRPDGAITTYSGPAIWSPSEVHSLPTQTAPLRSQTLGREQRVAEALFAAAARHSIGEPLLGAVAWRESHWKPDALSSKGARGIMQLMPGTAAALHASATDLDGNIDGGARYLVQLLQRFHGNVIWALAAYNAGPAAVIRYGGIPPYPETQKFVAAVLDRLADISLAQSSPGASP